jgi:RHS repeat-associated protein
MPRGCYDYFPFGEELSAGIGSRPACYTNAVEPAQKFTGKERDAETGLDYFGARYLSAAQGRLTSPDRPLLDQHSEDPQSFNLYSYVRNNPLTYHDPNGQVCIWGIGNTCNVPPPPPPSSPPAPRNPAIPVFVTVDQAGAAGSRTNQQMQQQTGNEYASSVYALGPVYTYTDPVTQNKPDTVDPNNTTGYYSPRTASLYKAPIPTGTPLVGETHSHPDVVKAADGTPAPAADQLSHQDMTRSQDMTTIHRRCEATYVGLPDGRVIKYSPRAPAGKRVSVVR